MDLDLNYIVHRNFIQQNAHSPRDPRSEIHPQCTHTRWQEMRHHNRRFLTLVRVLRDAVIDVRKFPNAETPSCC